MPRGRAHRQRLRRARGRGQPGGLRESLGLDVVTAEDGAAWLAFVRGLVARGLAGVKLVSSDAHPGLVDAIASTLPGAAWQRCRTHFMRNLLTRVPKSAQSFVATMVRTIFAQPDSATVREQHARIVAQLETRFPEAAALLEEAGPDLLAEPHARGVAARHSPKTAIVDYLAVANAFASDLEQAGATLRLGFEVTALQSNGPTVKVRSAD